MKQRRTEEELDSDKKEGGAGEEGCMEGGKRLNHDKRGGARMGN